MYGRKAAFSTTQMAGSAGSAGYGCLDWYEFSKGRSRESGVTLAQGDHGKTRH